jgi:hypothetical protein
MSEPRTAIITDPGKFEGEPEFMLTVWTWVMDGIYDENIDDGDTCVSVYRLDTELRDMTDTHGTTDDYLLVWETSQGFVYHRFMSEEQLNRYRAECEEVEECDI